MGVALWEEDSTQASLGTHKTRTQANSLSGLLLSIVAGRLKTRLKTPVLTVWETLAILCPPRPPVPLDNIPRNYPTCPLPWGSLSQLPSRYFHRPTEMDAKLRASRERPHGSAGGAGIRRHRMRFSVRVRTQNAPFRRARFFSPAQTWRPDRVENRGVWEEGEEDHRLSQNVGPTKKRPRGKKRWPAPIG